jgi:hypothetical protein
MTGNFPKPEAPKKRWFEKASQWATEFVVAILLFYAVIQFSDRIEQRSRSELPASAWFKVNEIYVPDHVVGSNPPVIYDRVILENFRGFFVVEVQKKLDNGLWWSACSGSGVSDYHISDALPANNTVDWEWFVSRPCVVPAGIYRLRVSWEMKRSDWPVKSVVSLSNEFLVVEPGVATSLPTPATTDEPERPLYGRSEDN